MRCAGFGIERSVLMRIFSIAQWANSVQRQCFEISGVEPSGDHTVVGNQSGKGLRRTSASEFAGNFAGMGFEELGERIILRGISQRDDMIAVLSGGANDGRPADVNLFDDFMLRSTGRKRLLKRIKVNDDE